MTALSDVRTGTDAPCFGLIMIGGSVVGSAVRDLRLANELAERGFRVHVYWAMDRTPVYDLHPSIRQDWLFSAARYNGFVTNLCRTTHSSIDDWLGRTVTSLLPFRWRHWLYQRELAGFDMVKWAMRGLFRHVCRGVEVDRRLLKNFARQLQRDGVTHLLPNLSVFAPFCEAVQTYLPQRIPYLVTFQGYEVYGQYARDINLTESLYARLKAGAEASDYPAVAVSEDYRSRVVEDIGLTHEQLTVVPACTTLPEPPSLNQAQSQLAAAWPEYRPDVPLITYLGRQDAEKGIDLLLYAAQILRRQGQKFQVAVCGPTSWGKATRDTVQLMADHLRLPVMWGNYLTEELRTALFRASHCVVYPPIHREPFGMVPVEAMAIGTPVVVPDTGGVAELPHWGDLHAGLNFRSWDSGDLAVQLARMLLDDTLYQSLRENARTIAGRYSPANVLDQMLNLMDLPLMPEAAPAQPQPQISTAA